MIKGKVVLVPFPFDDLTATKVRPAVCLTDAIGPHRHVVIAFISSQVAVDIIPSDIAPIGHRDHSRHSARTRYAVLHMAARGG
jgi:hypothetical protein